MLVRMVAMLNRLVRRPPVRTKSAFEPKALLARNRSHNRTRTRPRSRILFRVLVPSTLLLVALYERATPVARERNPTAPTRRYVSLATPTRPYADPPPRFPRTFDPIIIALVRGAGAGIAALAYLVLSKSRLPNRRQVVRLWSAAVGMVVIFPIFASIALRYVPSTHASVLASVLPLATAVFGVLRGRESASRGFWIFAILGTVLIGLFSACRSGFRSIEQADVLLLIAFIACAYGYAEGGLLAREMGGWRVICWALVTVLPFELVALAVYWSGNGVRFEMANADAWAALFYLTVLSQFIGFFFYYKGLAMGGVAKMSQVQLLLPFLSIFAAHWVLGEEVDGSVIFGALAITAIVVAGGARGKRVGVTACRRSRGNVSACRRIGVSA